MFEGVSINEQQAFKTFTDNNPSVSTGYAYKLLSEKDINRTEHASRNVNACFARCTQSMSILCSYLNSRLYRCRKAVGGLYTKFCTKLPSGQLSADLCRQGEWEAYSILYWSEVEWSKTIRKSKHGKRVYLPNEAPGIILKQSGEKSAFIRFQNMQEVRSIVDTQKSSHLIIPKAAIYKNFIIEERLPINDDSFYNMELYLSHLPQFDEVVREFTRLFSKKYIGDLVTWGPGPLASIEGVGNKVVRYDNLPFYIVEINGIQEVRIGLIDLEFLDEPQPDGLANIVRIFPYHLAIIKEEAKKLKMHVNDHALEEAAAEGRQFLLVGFTKHIEWIKQKGVPVSDNAHPPFEVSVEEEMEFTRLIEEELLKLNQGIHDLFVRRQWSYKPPKDFFIQNPIEVAKELAPEISKLIIRNMNNEIEKHQKEQISTLNEQVQKPMTEAELVRFRSSTMKSEHLHQDVVELIESRMTKIDHQEKQELAEQLVYVIMQALVKQGKLFSFDSNRNGWSWIRY